MATSPTRSNYVVHARIHRFLNRKSGLLHRMQCTCKILGEVPLTRLCISIWERNVYKEKLKK